MAYSMTQILLLFGRVLLHKTYIRKQTAVLWVSPFSMFWDLTSRCAVFQLSLWTLSVFLQHSESVFQVTSITLPELPKQREANFSQEPLRILWTQTQSPGKRTARKKQTRQEKTNKPLWLVTLWLVLGETTFISTFKNCLGSVMIFELLCHGDYLEISSWVLWNESIYSPTPLGFF